MITLQQDVGRILFRRHPVAASAVEEQPGLVAPGRRSVILNALSLASNL
jgi:hypothetical protein